eukprot:610029-Ditylum_brightwellii.AAC.1
MGLRNLLEDIGHPQQPIKIKTDNKTANSFVHASMHIKRNKSWDMQWHWLAQGMIWTISQNIIPQPITESRENVISSKDSTYV